MISRNTKKPIKADSGATKITDNNNPNSNEKTALAHDQAEADIQQDAEFSSHSPNDDLDEAETARLGDDKTDLV